MGRRRHRQSGPCRYGIHMLPRFREGFTLRGLARLVIRLLTSKDLDVWSLSYPSNEHHPPNHEAYVDESAHDQSTIHMLLDTHHS